MAWTGLLLAVTAGIVYVFVVFLKIKCDKKIKTLALELGPC